MFRDPVPPVLIAHPATADPRVLVAAPLPVPRCPDIANTGLRDDFDAGGGGAMSISTDTLAELTAGARAEAPATHSVASQILFLVMKQTPWHMGISPDRAPFAAAVPNARLA